uniref:Ribosomal protein L29 n=1 Tax=Pterothamnion crispum TaxID=1550583 RepID=A0A4D6WX12_9FLOR|nr:ribosomal protein L29 [Pterothamnion crispum]
MKLNIKKEWENLDLQTIANNINELKKEIIFLKVKQATQQNIKPHLFKNKKNELAQMLTLETLKKQK